jgi:uroporphyrinogen III methyltransferase/synthase
MKAVGTVYLVGAGPGDPKLLTLRALELLQQADVVILDRLVNPRLIRRYAPHARLVDVGKGPRGSSGKQAAINQRLIRYARAGNNVVRLKGGDPVLFGRGAEEAVALVKAKVPFEIVPGITSAVAVPAYAGIPLTHREHASSVAIITGHEDPRKPQARLDWQALARGVDTLICLMAVETLPQVVQQLLQHGKPRTTPAALIEWGTRAIQRTVCASLGAIAAKARAHQIGPPALLVVGEVVRLRAKMNWFERRPLFGTRILVTRAVDKAASLMDRLEALGASVELLPAIELRAARQVQAFKAALDALEPKQWVFFTSPAGIEWFVSMARRVRRDIRALHDCHIAAIGPKTAQSIEAWGVHVDAVAQGSFSQEGLVAALRRRRVRGVAATIFSAAQTREALVEGLSALGMRVNKVAVYATVVPKALSKTVRDIFERRFDYVTATSASCVEHVHAVLKANRLEEQFRRLPFASIGPVTSAAIVQRKGSVALEARRATVDDLIEAIRKHVRRNRGSERQT